MEVCAERQKKEREMEKLQVREGHTLYTFGLLDHGTS